VVAENTSCQEMVHLSLIGSQKATKMFRLLNDEYKIAHTHPNLQSLHMSVEDIFNTTD